MKLSYGLVIVALLVASSHSTPFHKCDEGKPPLAVRIDGCDKEPCLLYRGQNARGEMDFAVDSDTKILKPKVLATALGVTVPYPLPQKDGCTTLLNAQCPLDAGEQATHVLTMPVLKMYPKVSVLIQFSLVDQNNKVVVCYKVQTKVTDK